MRPLPFAAVTVSACLLSGFLIQTRSVPAPVPPLFTDAERAALVAFWSAPNRYVVEPTPPDAKGGPWVARLTPDGSTWLLGYQRAVAGARKVPPSQAVKAPDSGPTAGWEKWLSAKIASDWSQARLLAGGANAQIAPVAPIAGGPRPAPTPTPTPADAPGAVPATLVSACGNPPTFAQAALPLRYSVRLDDSGESFVYTDHVKLPERFAYYRWDRGVVSYGKRVDELTEEARGKLFRNAGFDESDRRIFQAVSRLEGGFETVQTYDTGYLSVGFIQFVTLAEGKHDLSKVLEMEKRENPDAFRDDFRRFGIDVQPDLSLTVIDPATGAELTGGEAVRKTVEDKRLVAVFQRAGRHSAAFQVAQIKVARSFYWAQDDAVTALLPDGTQVSGKVGEIVRSEAGIATLLDRKINTGNIRPFADVVARVMADHRCACFADLKPYEREIVAAMKYRTDFLTDSALSQPPAPVTEKKDKPQKVSRRGRKDWLHDLLDRF